MNENLTAADIAAVTRGNGYGYGDGMFGGGGGWFIWIFALLILPMLTGNGGWFGNNRGNPVTEADLCNANSFNELKGSVGRLSDYVGNMYTGLQNGLCNLGYTTLENFNALERWLSTAFQAMERQFTECCCRIERGIDAVNAHIAQATGMINATTTSVGQKILDKLCNMELNQERARGDQLAQRLNYVEMQQMIGAATAGVVRYPMSTSYVSNCNPFSWGGCGCGNGNV